MTDTSLLGRIFSKVEFQNGGKGCWIWRGRLSGSGYGRISVRGTERATHQAVYMLLRGAVFKGEVLDHKCKNRACCNPDHLEPVSGAENTRRGDAGKGPRGPDGKWMSKPRDPEVGHE